MSNKSLLFFTCTFVYLVVSNNPSAHAQKNKKFDITAWLNGLDKNKNGTLEQGEMAGGTGTYLKAAGLDIRQSLGIRFITERVTRHYLKQQRIKEDAKSNTLRSERTKKNNAKYDVPGFDTDPIIRLGVPDFQGAVAGMSQEVMAEKFGTKIMEEVERTIKQFDKNKDGTLGINEVRKARWGNPSPQESDTNSDGKLTRLELALRFQTRETAKNGGRSSNNFSNSKTKPASSSDSKSQKPDLKSRMVRFDATLKKKSDFRKRMSSLKSGTSVRAKTKSKSKKNFNSGNDKYRRYADGLVKAYDKNKDGKLDKDEVGKMRSPPKDADSNHDGFITRDELARSVSKKNSPSSTKSTKIKKKGSEPSGESKGKRLSSGSREFAKLDSNEDGQIQMSEFVNADDWTLSVVTEFKAKDSNHDGIITLEEWNSSSN